jgi:hypothetical protein
VDGPQDMALLTGVKIVANALKEVWSQLDATSEKTGPSQQLTEKGIRAIQGVSDAAQGATKSASG